MTSPGLPSFLPLDHHHCCIHDDSAASTTTSTSATPSTTTATPLCLDYAALPPSTILFAPVTTTTVIVSAQNPLRTTTTTTTTSSVTVLPTASILSVSAQPFQQLKVRFYNVCECSEDASLSRASYDVFPHPGVESPSCPSIIPQLSCLSVVVSALAAY